MKSRLLQIALWVWIILAAAVFFVKGFYPGFTKLESDFQNYYLSSKLLMEGENAVLLHSHQLLHF